MATPASGNPISMDDMRNEITRSAGALSMSEIRTRYGGSSDISFSDLYRSEGFVVTSGTYTNKFSTTNGFSKNVATPKGSVSPAESNGSVQFATNAFLRTFQSGGVSAIIEISDQNSFSANGDNVTSGFKVTQLTRAVAANAAVTLGTATSNSTQSQISYTGYSWPSSGTIHCLLKW